MSITPVDRQTSTVTISWNPESVKKNMKEETNAALDKANGIAKTTFKPMIATSMTSGIIIGGEVIKEVIDQKVPSLVRPCSKGLVDIVVVEAINKTDTVLMPKIDEAINSTTETAKKAINVSIDYTVDAIDFGQRKICIC